MKIATFILSGLFATLFAFLFFAQSWVSYAATPPDPQKPVGYVFIVLYSVIFGGAVFGLCSSLLLAFGWAHGRGRLVTLFVVAIVCAAIIAGLLLRHWRDLFPGSTAPNHAMQLTATGR